MPHRTFVLVLISILLQIGALCAQPIDREMFAKTVRSNSERNCPMEVDGVTLERLSYTPGRLHFHITANEMSLMELSVQELKELCADRLRYRLEHSYFNYLYSHLGDIGGGFSYDIQIEDSDSSFSIQYSPQETKQIWADRNKPAYKNGERWEARLSVRQTVYETNKALELNNLTYPLVWDSVIVSNDTLIYTFYTSADSIFPRLAEKEEVIRKNTKNELLANADLIEEAIEAEYNIRFQYANFSRTDRFIIDFSLKELHRLLLQNESLSLANDKQMNQYMQQVAQECVEYMQENEIEGVGQFESAEYNDGILELVYSVPEGKMNFNLTPSEQELIKNTFISVLKTSIDNDFDTPDIQDSIIITKELFYEYLKGFRVLYMEQNTHRATDIFITPLEIQNGKYWVSSMDSITAEKVREQLQPELFANEVEKYSRENFPTQSGNVLINRAYYDGQYLHYEASIEQTAQISSDTNEIRASLAHVLSFAKSSADSFFEQLLSMNCGVAYHYHLLDKDSTLNILFTADDLRAIFANDNSSIETAYNTLSLTIQSTNQQCPLQVDIVTWLDSIGLERDGFVYYFRITVPTSSLNNMRSLIRTQLMSTTDENLRYLLHILIETQNGLCYRYTYHPTENTSDKKKKKGKKAKEADSLNICFTVEELKEILGE